MQINVLGKDLYSYDLIDTIDSIKESKSFQNNKLIINNYNIKCKNLDNFFSMDNGKSFFNGRDWLYQPVEIINDDNITIWSGVIKNIERNETECVIQTQDNLTKFQNKIINYVSSGWETPATAAKNIMDNFGFTNYDLTSITSTINYQTANSCYCKVTIYRSDNVNLLHIIEKLAVYSCSYCYQHLGNVYFKAWKPYSGGQNASITKNDIIGKINIKYLVDDMINQYSIGYDGDLGVPATDSTIGTISRAKYGIQDIKELRSDSTGHQICFKDATSSNFIGSQYIKRTNKNYLTSPQPIQQITFQLDYNFYTIIDLNTIFKLTWNDESWTDKVFEVMEFKRDETKRTLNITAYEVV